jgi:hypothetical protein
MTSQLAHKPGWNESAEGGLVIPFPHSGGQLGGSHQLSSIDVVAVGRVGAPALTAAEATGVANASALVATARMNSDFALMRSSSLRIA